MNKFTKTLSLSVFLATSLFAGDAEVLNFQKNRLSQNPNVKLEKLEINSKKKLPISGWEGYIFDVEAKIKNETLKVKDIIFSDGNYIALDLIDSKSGRSLKDIVTPNLTSKYYDSSKLIAGNENAKDKIVVFSDPLCPFCMDYIPDVINYVNKNSDSIALYYYHFPLLQIHPAANALSKLMILGKEKGIKDIEIKVYQADWDKYFDSKTKDDKKVLEAFNKEFNTNITLAQLQDKKLEEEIKADIQAGNDVMVRGTPTIFVNGEKDVMKNKYETLGKK